MCKECSNLKEIAERENLKYLDCSGCGLGCIDKIENSIEKSIMIKYYYILTKNVHCL